MTTIDMFPGLPDGALGVDHATADFNGNSYISFQDNLKRSYTQFSTKDHGDDLAYTTNGPIHFDPDLHLAFTSTPKVHTMEDIDLPASGGVSPMAVSEPFPLFTEEAINIMREEILSDDVMNGHAYTSDIAPKQLRGYAPKHAKFVYEAWKHPRTLELISKIAGIDVVPVIDYEIGHINIAIPGKIKDHNNEILIAEDDEKAVVDWHRDSYPFVCVLMMSDTTGMVGGETALRTGNGSIKKVRGPSKGCAAVLQGRYIEHQALRAFGSQERITMVTSFRPRSPFTKDDTVLNTVRPVSNLSDLYGQVAEYQLENTEARLRRILKIIRDTNKVGATNVTAIKQYLDFEIAALTHLNNEIVEEHKVKKGALAEVCEADRLITV